MSHSMPDDDKISRVTDLIKQLEAFDRRLTENNNLVVHRHIDQFFYMQKAAELKVLLNEYQMVRERLSEIAGWLDEKYRLGLSRWKEDTVCLDEIQKQEGISN